jgi:hypothetical protein
VQLNPIPTELTTAATDVALGVLAVGCMSYLVRFRERDRWKVGLWSWLFGLLAAAALLGAVAHGFAWSVTVWDLLWFPLFLLLGLTVALFVVGAIYDWRGLSAAKRSMPFMIVLAVIFFGVTQVISGAFLVFVLYEAVAMLFAFGLYGYLAAKVSNRAMTVMLIGVGLNIVAAAIQATQAVSFTLVWPFDHNGVFHLVQMVALLVLCAGLRMSLVPSAASDGHARRVP